MEEIASISKSEMRSEEFYQQFLTRVVAACDARGGGVWLVRGGRADGKSEFELAAAVDLESSLFQSDEEQRGLILQSLSEVVKAKKPVVIGAEAGAAAGSGSLQAQLSTMGRQAGTGMANRAPYPFVHVPLFLKEQVLGVLQVWLQPYVVRENYGEFATFLTQLAGNVEQHFQSRRLGNLVVENQRMQHLLKFVGDLTGSLDPVEVARLAANYGRDLFGCERCAVMRRRGTSWEVLSISGQEVVEKKSSMVKTMAAFVAAHTPGAPLPPPAGPEGAGQNPKPWVLALSKKELLALAEKSADAPGAERALVVQPHGPTDAADIAYFEMSHVVSALIVQLLDADHRLIGVLLAESTTEGFFDIPAGAREAPPAHRLAEWIAGNSGRALQGAGDYRDLPFLSVTRRLRDARRRFTGDQRLRHSVRTVLLLVLIGAVLFFPWMEEIESDCTLIPHQRVKIVPETGGRVMKIHVKEGAAVKTGDKIAELDTSTLESELKSADEERLAATAEAERFRGLGEPAGERIAQTRVRAAEVKAARLRKDIEAATLLSPIDGIVLTKDIEIARGVYLQPGAEFAVVGSATAWDLQVHVGEKQIGRVEALLAKSKDVPVHFILHTHNTHELTGVFKDRSQLSQVAYPRQNENAIKENAFILTLPDVQAPEEVRRGFRPDLTGRSSIPLGRKPLVFLWARNISEWFRLKWVW